MPTRSTPAPRIVLIAVAALLPGRIAAQSDPPPLAPARVAAQIGAGIVAMPIGFVAVGKATERVAAHLGVDDPAASRVALVGGYTGAALAASAGPALVGARGPGVGSYAAALGGSLAGGAGSYLLVRMSDRRGAGPRPPCRLACALSAIAVFALPSVGAAMAYNATRRAAR